MIYIILLTLGLAGIAKAHMDYLVDSGIKKMNGKINGETQMKVGG